MNPSRGRVECRSAGGGPLTRNLASSEMCQLMAAGSPCGSDGAPVVDEDSLPASCASSAAEGGGAEAAWPEELLPAVARGVLPCLAASTGIQSSVQMEAHAAYVAGILRYVSQLLVGAPATPWLAGPALSSGSRIKGAPTAPVSRSCSAELRMHC
jgi:hypothetical protein